MMLWPSANGSDTSYGTVFVYRVLLLEFFVSLLLDYFFNTGTLLLEFFVEVSFENTVIQRLKHAVHMVGNIQLAIGVNQVL